MDEIKLSMMMMMMMIIIIIINFLFHPKISCLLMNGFKIVMTWWKTCPKLSQHEIMMSKHYKQQQNIKWHDIVTKQEVFAFAFAL